MPPWDGPGPSERADEPHGQHSPQQRLCVPSIPQSLLPLSRRQALPVLSLLRCWPLGLAAQKLPQQRWGGANAPSGQLLMLTASYPGSGGSCCCGASSYARRSSSQLRWPRKRCRSGILAERMRVMRSQPQPPGRARARPVSFPARAPCVSPAVSSPCVTPGGAQGSPGDAAGAALITPVSPGA